MEKEVEDCRMEVDSVFQKLMNYVHQVDSLKDENKRLKKHLKDLQAAHVKVQAELRNSKDAAFLQSPPISPVGSNVVENEVAGVLKRVLVKLCDQLNNGMQEVESAVLNSVVLDNIFSRLSSSGIRTCRLVCQTWNDVGTRVLSRENNGLGPGIIISDGIENFRQKQAERILSVRSVMASAPRQMFRKAFLDDKSFVKPGFSRMFKDFGPNLRSIVVTSGLVRWTTIYNILTVWCPNLEELDFNYLRLCDENEMQLRASYLKDLQQLRVLKLQTLKMNMNWKCSVHPAPLELAHDSDDDSDGGGSSSFLPKEDDVIEILGAIIGASLHLKNLTLKGCDAGGTAKLLHKMQSFPEVTKHLETIFMCGSRSGANNNPLKELNGVELSNKLRSLTIASAYEEAMVPKEELLTVLAKVSRWLHSLTVVYNNGAAVNAQMIAASPTLEFPEMRHLVNLRYLADVAYQIKSIDFLVKMPKLKKLFLSGSAEYFHDANPFADRIFSNCKLLTANPHIQLNELRMYGPIEAPAALFQVINNIFPNLTILQVCLSPLVGDGYEPSNYWIYFNEAFEGISHIKGLNKLYLDLCCYRNGIGKSGLNPLEWTAVFNHLQKLENLSYLAFNPITVNDIWDWDFDGEEFPWLGHVFVTFPKLRRVTIYGVDIDTDDEDEEKDENGWEEAHSSEKLHIQWMYENGIHLDYRAGGMDVFFEHDTLKCDTTEPTYHRVIPIE